MDIDSTHAYTEEHTTSATSTQEGSKFSLTSHDPLLNKDIQVIEAPTFYALQTLS